METINNLANAASKAVFGEQREPVSGVQGDVSKGEPYDAGNLATPAQEKYQDDPLTGTSNLKSDNAVSQQTPSTSTTTNPTSFHDLTTSGGSSTTTGRDTTLSGQDNSLSGRDNISGRDNNLSGRDTNISGHETTLPTRDAATTTTTTHTSSHENTLGRQDNDTASREDKVSGGNKDTTSGQNDTRDPKQVRDDPSTKQDLDTNTPGTSKASELKGPGPRPVETVAKEHGGDAGQVKVGENSKTSSSDSTSRTENQPANSSESNLENKPKVHQGTHKEQVVHASGFAADGGDFDATKPGAGEEADRLLDEKREHGGAVGLPEKKSHTHGESHGLGGSGSGSGSHGHDDKEKDKEDKPSLGERIKAKLHRH